LGKAFPSLLPQTAKKAPVGLGKGFLTGIRAQFLENGKVQGSAHEAAGVGLSNPDLLVVGDGVEHAGSQRAADCPDDCTNERESEQNPEGSANGEASSQARRGSGHDFPPGFADKREADELVPKRA
jgi:hypothetical protein